MPCQWQFSPCCGTHCCKPLNPSFPSGEQHFPFSESPYVLPFSRCLQAVLSINSLPLKQTTCYRFARFTSVPEAQQVYLWNKLHGKAEVKFLITNQVLEGKQWITKATSSAPVIVRFLWGTETEETNQLCSAPSVLSWRISISLAFLSPLRDSDSCWVASWVQMKYQIISWGLQFPFLLIF